MSYDAQNDPHAIPQADLDAAFKKLGLTPLDEWLSKLPDGQTRHIGATTWMLVEAALNIIAKKRVVIVGPTLSVTSEMVKACRTYVVRLHKAQMLHITGRKVEFEDAGGVLFWDSERTRSRHGVNLDVTYRNSEWVFRTIDRRKNPFLRVRKIRRWPGGSFMAYGESDEFLMELEESGAMELITRFPWHVTRIGW
jgi:hypothetical protein